MGEPFFRFQRTSAPSTSELTQLRAFKILYDWRPLLWYTCGMSGVVCFVDRFRTPGLWKHGLACTGGVFLATAFITYPAVNAWTRGNFVVGVGGYNVAFNVVPDTETAATK